ncbi:hypothetical protein [Profundibacter amoris]|uniref:Uncharacterized protein n=1 Tax=Profundibacter amoris TaxID=2171755 RepID=A0A347UIY4_9RHOB|nr:hypothetical protein [Profundibacter amoris]AXX98812.1 hypothetical protein BAR1_13285 [Profundibacter amoris]
MQQETELKYHDFEVVEIAYTSDVLKLFVRPNRAASIIEVITLSGVSAIRLGIMGGQIVISRIEKEPITLNNISFVNSFFGSDEQVLISENATKSIFVSIDTHVGMSLLSVCEEMSFGKL